MPFAVHVKHWQRPPFKSSTTVFNLERSIVLVVLSSASGLTPEPASGDGKERGLPEAIMSVL